MPVSNEKKLELLGPMLCQGVLQEINVVREYPQSYAVLLKSYLPYYKGKSLYLPQEEPAATVEGAAVMQETINELMATKPLKPLALPMEPGLTAAAEKHAKDIGEAGSNEHTGTDGSHPVDRMLEYGKSKYLSACGEALSFGMWDPKSIVLQLLVDDGIPGRGHRRLLLNPKFGQAGVAITRHKDHGVMCCVVFADYFGESLIEHCSKLWHLNPKKPDERQKILDRIETDIVRKPHK